MTAGPPIARRTFLASIAATSGSLVLGFDLDASARNASASAELTAWIVINADDSVIIRVARSEMGQGISTALPMLIAEELGCNWSSVRVEFPEPGENLRRNRAWGDFSTGGSRSIRNSQQALRRAGAMARAMLVTAAARRWNVAAEDCTAANGVVTHRPSGNALRYGELAAAAAEIAPPRDPALRKPKDWRLAGRPTRRVDVSDKVQGKALYGIDVRLPGMLHASIRQCPVFGGKLVSVDEKRIAAHKGVRKVVKLADAVAVVADTWWQANQAVQTLDVAWTSTPSASVTSDAINAFVRSGLDDPEAGIGLERGDIKAGLAAAAVRIEADYTAPFLAHATLEPQNCTARVTADSAEIWAPTQNGEASLAAAAHALDLPPSRIRLHKTLLGGGFGRRGAVQDFVRQAVLIAREAGAPVKTTWSREQDIRHDYYRPVAMARMSAGLDGDGNPLAWRVRLAGHSILGSLMPQLVASGVDKNFMEGFLADCPYKPAAYLADYAMRNTHVPVGFWRGVNHTQNCFFRESFIDEMAAAAKVDPMAYRRKLIGHGPRAERLLAVLNAAAERAGWGQSAQDNLHRGIALNDSHGTAIAAVAVISTRGDAIVLHRFVVAIDPGTVVNPLTVEEQVESGVAFGLTAARFGEITIEQGGVAESNFHDYRILRMGEMPQVETILMPSGSGFGGVGEPPVPVVAPALCNALFSATGQRSRTLPLKSLTILRA